MTEVKVTNEAPRKPCGIVMPISGIDGCSEEHWTDVQEVLADAIDNAGFEPNLVSNADEVGIIHKRIIQNLYDNEIVVCDVSGKNPNVMFELGLRLAFDKPTIIVKDDRTPYSFDTAAIEHLEYPRDLRYSKIVEFKERLSDKIRATHQRAATDPHFTTFLKHFGEFTVAKIDKKEVPSQQFVIEELKLVRQALAALESRPSAYRYRDYDLGDRDETIIVELSGLSEREAHLALEPLQRFKAVSRIEIARTAGKRPVAIIHTRDAAPMISHRIRQEARNIVEGRRKRAQPPLPSTSSTTETDIQTPPGNEAE